MDPNNLKNPNLWGEQMQERVPNLRTNVDIICGLFVDIFGHGSEAPAPPASLSLGLDRLDWIVTTH